MAFIDDDEFPPPQWPTTLFNAYKTFKVDGVLGQALDNPSVVTAGVPAHSMTE